MHDARSYAVAAGNAVLRFFSGHLFFIVVGCLFVYFSYVLFSQLTPCGTGAPSIPCSYTPNVNLAFGLAFAALGIAFLIYGVSLYALAHGQIVSLKQIYDEIKLFFSSPIFYLLFGCLLIYFAVSLLDETHPAFVFILAILGISMILFGTGSQAVASAEVPSSVKLNASIAGGAAALAAIFGYGSVVLSEGIQGFFKRSVDYGFLELSTTGSSTPGLNLDDLTITASLVDGRPLHILKQFNKLQIMVPRYSRHGSSIVTVAIKGPNVPLNTPGGLLVTPYAMDWDLANSEQAFGNEKILIRRLAFKLPTTQSTAFDERGNAVESTALTAN